MSKSVLWLAVLVACESGNVAGSAADAGHLPEVVECPADEPTPPEQVVARWDGGELTYEQVRRRVAADLRNMEIQHRIKRYEVQSRVVEQLAMEALLEAEARKRQYPDVETLLREEVEAHIEEPSDEEVEAFYPIMARNLGGAPLEQARPYLRQELLRRAQAEHYGRWLNELRRESGLGIDLPYPELPRVQVPVRATDPSRGPAEAPVTIVQFAEYQCAYCNVVNQTLERLLRDYDGQVRLVFKDFPLSGHSRAVPAAIAARCAGEQDGYWQMNATLLANQTALADADLLRYARGLDLDMDRFESCLQANRYEAVILEDIEHGRQAGVQATPSFFINGIFLSGAQPYERFAAIIERELGRSADATAQGR